MDYVIKDNRIILESEYFSAQQICYSGQVFRFRPHKNGYVLISGREVCYLQQQGREVTITCTDPKYFVNYFDLDTDYGSIVSELKNFGGITADAAEFGKGIRILRQDKLETVFSFIISANNNIKRIQGILENICGSLGKPISFMDESFSAFPEAAALAGAGEEFFYKAGCGYRAPYMVRTAGDIASGFDLNAIAGMDYSAAAAELSKLYGVGKKVADCILLFGYGRQDVFPVDTWIEKVYRDDFAASQNCKNLNRKQIADRFVEIFKHNSGYAQQYLFYYKRIYDKI